MANGLTLGIDEFKRLPTKEQLTVLYENQVQTMHLIKSYRFKQYIQWAWLSSISAVNIWFLDLYLSNT